MGKQIIDMVPKSLSIGTVYSLQLDEVLNRILSTVCNEMGFMFATISIVDEDQEEIQTVRGKNVPEAWIKEAHHLLTSDDIQADVLRTGKAEVVTGWDPRFDRKIWTKFHHKNLIRVFVPIGKIGTIEAGFSKRRRKRIEPKLVQALKRYADEITVALENALLHEQVQQHAAMLAELNEVSYRLQTEAQQDNEPRLFRQIVEAALHLFQADIVTLYPLERSSLGERDVPRFTQRIFASGGTQGLKGSGEIKLPNDPGNIVQTIAERPEIHYIADAQHSPLLVGDDPHSQRTTFTVRQRIRSFAGVPLESQGELVGVLCINYRTRRRFSDHTKQIIELFAQQVAVVLKKDQLAREQERRKERQRIQEELHGSAKSSIRGLLRYSKKANSALKADPPDLPYARELLHEVRRTAWEAWAETHLILGNLASENGSRMLAEQVRSEVRRLARGYETEVVEIVDEHLDERFLTFPLELSRTLLSVMRESVVNALEHAQAGQIFVHISYTDHHLCLVVADDGQGFEPEQERGTIHRGLTIMSELVEAIEGELKIESYSGKGTTVRVKIPLWKKR